MTISIAWIRKVREGEELWIASDSRLSGNGTTWDECMKLNILPGDGSFIAFAGNTNIAYPILNQISSTIKSHRKSMLGYLDIKSQKGHILNVINTTINNIKFEVDEIKKEDLGNTEFMFGGYSWYDKQFRFWKFNYNFDLKRYIARKPALIKDFGKCLIAGDITYEGVRLLNQFLNKRREEKISQNKAFTGFDLEPLELLRDLLRDNENNKGTDSYLRTIGGAVQIIKIYQHANAEPIGVFWPDKNSGNPNLLGRYMQGYEHTDCIYMDLDNLNAKRISSPNYWE